CPKKVERSISEDSQHSQICLKYYNLCLTAKTQSLLRLVAQEPLVASSFSLYPLKEKNLGESLGRRQWWPPHGTVKGFFAPLAQNISKTIPMSDTLGIKEIEKEAKFPKYILFVHSSLSHQRVKCPYKKVDLSWFTGTVNPCPGLYQPICGTDFVTYENPCILCIESL
ncbi:hypothetical protein GH733_009714, partial [Mirounga leonina]